MAGRIGRAGLALAVALVAVALVPAVASAAVICVPADAPGCDDNRATLAAAVAAASDDDTIRIAAGSHNEPTVPVTKLLHFVGAGAGTLDAFDPAQHTRILSMADRPALILTGGGSVRSLRAVGGPGGGGGPPGIRLTGSDVDYSVSDVIGIGGTSSTTPGPGISVFAEEPVKAEVTGGAYRGGAKDGMVTGLGAEIFAPAPGTGELSLRDTELHGGDGLSVVSATAALERSTVNSTGEGVRILGGGSARIERSRILTSSTGVRVRAGGGAASSGELVNSLVEMSPPGVSDDSALNVGLGADGFASLDVRGSTILARGEGPISGVSVGHGEGLTGTTSADLRNTIVRVEGPAASTGADLAADRGTITADFSSFSTVIPFNDAVLPAPGSASNIAGDPMLAADRTLLLGSPLIDRGDPSVVAAGELDLQGNPRLADFDGDGIAAPDIGAFELPAPPRAQPPILRRPVISGFSISNRVFAPKPRGQARSAQRRKRRVKRGTSFRYTLSEAATVRITIERQSKGRRVRGKCRKPTRNNRKRRRCKRFKRAGVLRASEQAGGQSTAFSGRFGRKALKRGRYRARIVATNAQGGSSDERRLSFRVVRP